MVSLPAWQSLHRFAPHVLFPSYRFTVSLTALTFHFSLIIDRAERYAHYCINMIEDREPIDSGCYGEDSSFSQKQDDWAFELLWRPKRSSTELGESRALRPRQLRELGTGPGYVSQATEMSHVEPVLGEEMQVVKECPSLPVCLDNDTEIAPLRALSTPNEI